LVAQYQSTARTERYWQVHTAEQRWWTQPCDTPELLEASELTRLTVANKVEAEPAPK
jgi:hypothetical protein